MNQKWIFIGELLCLISLSSGWLLAQSDLSHHELHWDWSLIDMRETYFPKNFLWGVGTAEYQVSGAENCPQSNWARFENQKNWFGTPAIAHGDKSGKACDHWHLYKEDIALMKSLGVNAYRFSIEWSRIEPHEGMFDQEAMQHYSDVVDELLAQGITPMITLHHFSHPQWFEDRGAFEYEENIRYLVRFSQYVFEALADRVPFWCTINEPGVLAFQSKVRGVYPSGELDLQKAAEVTKNLMQAHVEMYRALKKMPFGDTAQIGIVHDIVQFEPYHKDMSHYNPCYVFEKTLTDNVNVLFHEAITEFLTTKKMHMYVSILADVTYELPDSTEKILDFIGLNYYSHAMINCLWPVDSAYRDGDIPTDMPYVIYPEGLYRAIDTVSKMGVPIYITENGLADSKDDRRELWLKQYLYTVSRALKDGYDVRGYFYWSLMDNFEWDMGFEKRYGLYEVDYTTLERKIRPSAGYYKKVIHESHEGTRENAQYQKASGHCGCSMIAEECVS